MRDSLACSAETDPEPIDSVGSVAAVSAGLGMIGSVTVSGVRDPVAGGDLSRSELVSFGVQEVAPGTDDRVARGFASSGASNSESLAGKAAGLRRTPGSSSTSALTRRSTQESTATSTAGGFGCSGQTLGPRLRALHASEFGSSGSVFCAHTGPALQTIRSNNNRIRIAIIELCNT